jgi:hypothetical protein
VSCHTGSDTVTASLPLKEGNGSGRVDEDAAAALLLSVIEYACGNSPEGKLEGSKFAGEEGDRVGIWRVHGGDPVMALLEGRVRTVEFSGKSGERNVVVDAPRRNCVVMPGSFNPLHDGHRCVINFNGYDTSGRYAEGCQGMRSVYRVNVFAVLPDILDLRLVCACTGSLQEKGQ